MKSIFFMLYDRNGKQEKCVPSLLVARSICVGSRYGLTEEECKAEFRFGLAELPL